MGKSMSKSKRFPVEKEYSRCVTALNRTGILTLLPKSKKSPIKWENMKEKSKFSVTHKDESIVELVRKTDHKTLAVWAVDCVERVMPYFEEKYPEDHRPRKAIEALQKWIRTGIFKMRDIRKAALDAHAAAREVGEDNAARSAARAAGQAVATAHVPIHSVGAANYALQAIYRATSYPHADAAIAKERDWQYQHLLELRNSHRPSPP